MSRSQTSLVVEGWRGVNHSFAIVNQFQLLEMSKLSNLNLKHTDTPFPFGHWSKESNGVGFHPADEATLKSIEAPLLGWTPDWTYRIFSAFDLRPPPAAGRLAVFLVTELGLDEDSFVSGSDIREFESAGNIVFTPSNWSRARIIDWGFQSETVRVVPHAASAEYFFPLQGETIRDQRKALGIQPEETVLLNIGAAIWNKGIDVLLEGFALARQTRKDLRLMFKDQRNTYGISGEGFVQTTLSNAGLLTNDVLNAITLIPANLSMDQMNAMYGVADCYVSPYRAEGFNLPVLEAMTCGTPVIVTSGGATDDFIQTGSSRTIEAKPFFNQLVQNKEVSGYREPSRDHLIQLLLETSPKTLDLTPSTLDKGSPVGWGPVVNDLLSQLM